MNVGPVPPTLSPAASPTSPLDDVFNLAPVAMCCVDYSGIKTLIDSWAPGTAADLLQLLEAEPSRIGQAMAQMRFISVNRRLLALYEAADVDEMVRMARDPRSAATASAYMKALAALWDGAPHVSFQTVGFSRTGRRFEGRVNVSPLAGHADSWGHVAVSIEDITAEMANQRRLAESEAYAKALFQRAPAALWVEDFSAVKSLMDGLRAQGVTDFQDYIDQTPQFVPACVQAIRVVDMNEAALNLYEATTRDEMLDRFAEIFPAGEESAVAAEFTFLWNGNLNFAQDFKQLTLTGKPLYVRVQFSVLPGHEHDWSLVLLALTDFTERKQIEERLEFLTGHDVLTGLHNRSAYAAERERLEKAQKFPVGVIIADLNGLKKVNDNLGHEAGDALLRRAGAVLVEAAAGAGMVARIGGDEFVILLPQATELGCQTIMHRIGSLAARDRALNVAAGVSFATGACLCGSAEELDEAVKLADMRMYEAKRAHYAAA